MDHFYPIGTPGKPWTDNEKARWFEAQRIQRSYRQEVLDRLQHLDDRFTLEPYGALTIDPTRYPLMVARPSKPIANAPWALVTGGVHGYETSGVKGAISFLHTAAADYAARINLLIAPCVSPWGYEVINRWNPKAIDPNRSFVANSPAEESAALMKLVSTIDGTFLVHMDLQLLHAAVK